MLALALLGCGDPSATSTGAGGSGASGEGGASVATTTGGGGMAAAGGSGGTAGVGGEAGIGGTPEGTPLADLAATMASGDWTQMTPTPQGLELFVGGPTSGLKTGYATKMARDADGRRLFWIGCDHNQEQSFLLYDEASNAWTLQPTTPFAAATKHGYEHTTWDSSNGALWHRPYGTMGAYRWDGGSNWSFVSYDGDLQYASAANGFEFFPDLGPNGSLMVFQVENGTDGALIGIDPMTEGIVTYASGSALAGTGDPHNFAQYNPVSRVVWFGGGNSSPASWRIDETGAVAALTDAPSSLGTLGPGNGNSLVVSNPKGGGFMVFHSSTVSYDFDPTGAGTWTPRSEVAQAWVDNIYDSSQVVWGTVAAAIHEYDVVVFIKAHSQAAPAEMWIYKP
ncbi:MAG: hypothetical protein R3B72_17995 [Polyangiaceae bacterium]